MNVLKNDLSYRLTKEDEGLKIREILKRRLNISTKLMRKLKNNDLVTCNGKPIWLNAKALDGDVLGIVFPSESSHLAPEPIPLNVLFEDEDLLILNKQPGLVVHPTKGHPFNTLANGIVYHMHSTGNEFKIRFINRLDMNTTGVLMIGKNAFSQDDFYRQTKSGGIQKKYLAVVHGHVTPPDGVVDLPIDLEAEDAVKRIVREDGYPSITRYKTLEKFTIDFNAINPTAIYYSLLELSIETGRTHQIRVHMAHIGHSIAGDALYGESSAQLINRQALHATELRFLHPRTRESMVITAPLPDDMSGLLSLLRSQNCVKD
jgi:23S rRNA pseudouridine1911/1915/1917 synthase